MMFEFEKTIRVNSEYVDVTVEVEAHGSDWQIMAIYDENNNDISPLITDLMEIEQTICETV